MTRFPGTRAGITKDDVLTAALTVLESDGLEAVSMRRVAAEVGVAPNALYSHIRDKSELIDELIDRVLAQVAVPTGGTWRERLVDLLTDTHRVLLAHPDLVPHCLARQAVRPNALRLGEVMLEALALAGVTGERAVRALQVLLIHTIGATAYEIPRRDDPDPEARRRRGREAAQALDASSHPRITALADPMSTYPGDRVFRLGLTWLLDGIAR